MLNRVLAGRYELLEILGRGGMGVVYRARDVELGRTVAVKVLPSELTRQASFRSRFKREAQAAAGLAHPNIAVVHDINEDTAGDEPVPFLVMELVEGRTLSELVEDGPLDPEVAATIAVSVLDAIEHSHHRGVVHRDIKPSNIMVHRNGGLSVKVMDFGIAKILADTATRLTATGMLIGTPSYLSPEQAEGRPADARSDLYSFGCVLYELLTGRPPFIGDSPTVVLFQHLQRTADPPSTARPGLDKGWDQILGRVLAKNPDDRHSGPAELRDAIKAISFPRPMAPPPGPSPVATRLQAPERETATVADMPQRTRLSPLVSAAATLALTAGPLHLAVLFEKRQYLGDSSWEWPLFVYPSLVLLAGGVALLFRKVSVLGAALISGAAFVWLQLAVFDLQGGGVDPQHRFALFPTWAALGFALFLTAKHAGLDFKPTLSRALLAGAAVAIPAILARPAYWWWYDIGDDPAEVNVLFALVSIALLLGAALLRDRRATLAVWTGWALTLAPFGAVFF